MNNKDNDPIQPLPAETITRKEWLQKTGKYAAFTAGTMMLILNPAKSSAKDDTLPQIPPEW